MKTSIFLKNRQFSFQAKIRSATILGAALALVLGQAAHAASSTWTSATSGNWSTAANWSATTIPGATSGTTNTDTATFNASAGGTVTVDTGRNIQNINFDTNAGAYTFNSGSLILSNAGAIQLLSTFAAASTSTETFNAPITLEGTDTFSNNSAKGTLVIKSAVSSDTGVSGTLVLSGSATTGNVVSGVLSDGSGTLAINKTGAGTWSLTGTNTYSGVTTITGGILSTNLLANGGTASGIGQSSNAAANLVINGGTLQYTGGAASTDRNFTIGSSNAATIDASGTGALTVSGTAVYATANVASSLTLTGASTALNTLSGILANNGTGLTSVTKAGAGTWVLSGVNTYTGNTTIFFQPGSVTGSLIIGGSGSLGAGSYAGNIAVQTASFIYNSSANQTLSGTISGAGALTESGPGTLTITAANTFTGVTTVTAGTLVLGNNLALQDSALNTSGGGVVSVTGFTTPTIGGLTGTMNLASVITTGYSSITALTLNPQSGISDTYSGVIADGAVGMTLTKNGAVTQALNGANTYTGATTINSGVLSVSTLANGGTASGIGQSSSAAANLVFNGGTLQYTGGTASTNRSFTIGSGNAATIDASGSGALTLSGTAVFATTNVVSSLNLTGTSTAANTLSGTLVNNGSGVLGISKTGVGAWQLTGTANTYSGGTGVASGLLSVGSSSSIGTGGATVFNTGELRLSSASNVASGQTVTVNAGGILGVTSTGFTQTQLAALIASNSSGILAIDAGAFSNALNMAALGNGQMYLGSTTTGTYTASSLGITPGGTILGFGGVPITLGGTYHLGAGGGTLTITQDVLVDQASTSIPSNPTNTLTGTGTDGSVYSAVSNTRNALSVGAPSGGLGAGTLDLATNQDFTGVTTVNVGSTLALDFSGTPTGTINILNSANQVVLNGGTLSVIGQAGATTSQTLANVGLVGGADTISASQTSPGSLTLNLGTLGSGAAGAPLSVAGGVSLQIVQTGTATITTTTATNAVDGSYGGQVVYTNSSGTRWATGTLLSGTYTLSQLTTDTTALPTSGGSGTTDYNFNSGNTNMAGSVSVNLLRVSNAGGATLTPSATGTLTINGGILFTNTANFTLAQTATNGTYWVTSGAPANSGNYNFLNLQNYGTGGVTIGNNAGTRGVFEDNPTSGAHMVLVFGGPGTYNLDDPGNNTGGTVLDGATLNLSNGVTSVAPAGTFTINSGTIEMTESNGNASISTASIWNGNFTLLQFSGNRTALFSGPVLLNNNIALTETSSTAGVGWTISGPISDGGYGYGLTFNVSGPNAVTLSGANTFTGPVLLESGALSVGATSLNRNNVVSLASGATLSLAGSPAIAGLNDLGVASLTESVTAGGNALQLFGSGNYSFGGVISGAGVKVNNLVTSLFMNGVGTQVLTGVNTFTGAIIDSAGTLVVDASQGGSIAPVALIYAGGTYEFKGTATGTTETLGGLTNLINGVGSVGGSTVVLDNNGGAAGANILNLGALGSGTAGATLQIKEIGTAAGTIKTTTSNAASGVLGGAGDVVFTSTTGTTTWATSVGTTPFTIGAYTAETTLPTAATTSSVNYLMTANLASNIGTESLNLLRITGGTGLTQNSATTLTFANNGLLFTGSSAFSLGGGTIEGGNATGITIQNYGTAALTITSTIANSSAGASALTIAGPGTTNLTGSNTYTGVTYLNGGTVDINSLANFGITGTTGTAGIQFSGATLQYAAGFTGNSDLSSASEVITFNNSGGTIDTNGNTVTYAGAFGAGAGGLTVVDTAATHGSLTLNSSIGYTGTTIIQNGGSVNLGKSGTLATGAGTIVGNGGTLSGGATATTSTTPSTSNAGMVTLQSGGVLAPGNLTGIGSKLLTVQNTGLGSGGDQSAGALNNVLAATGLTWNAGGTLKFQLDSTTGQTGTATSLSSSTLLNLGSGALVKSGTGLFTINLQDTAADNTTPGSTNVYDLINFGAITTYGVTTANTNFNINDFTLENLSTDPAVTGSLSLYFNPLALNGAGQEELLLTTLETTAVPEPGTWAMLVAGFAFLIIVVRRRHRQG